MNNLTQLTKNFSFYSYEKTIVECYKLKYIGIYSLCLFIASVSINTTHFCILIKNKQLLQPVNLIVFSLTVVNLIGTLFEIPLVTLNALNCK